MISDGFLQPTSRDVSSINDCIRDLGVVQGLINKRFDLSECRETVVSRLAGLLNDDNPKIKLGAAKILASMEAMNQRDELEILKMARGVDKPTGHVHFWGGQGSTVLPPADESADGTSQAIDAEFIESAQVNQQPQNGIAFVEQASHADLLETQQVFADFDLYRGLGNGKESDESTSKDVEGPNGSRPGEHSQGSADNGNGS